MFDNVWLKGIIFKQKQKGIFGKVLSVLFDFLKGKKGRVTWSVPVSSWISVILRVPQGSVFAPFAFFVYINDLANGLSSNAKLFADDTSLFSVIHDVDTWVK